MAAKIRKGDSVVVIAGKDKGRTGKVTKVYPDADRVTVEGVNVVARAVRPSMSDPNGGIKRFEAPIHVSNVAIQDPKTGGPTRVGFKVMPDGRKVRVAKASGVDIDV
jgi:large subunit ribosomal protein L24